MKTKNINSTRNKREILLVEDSPTQAIQIKHLLESNNYKVAVAQNGKKALNSLTKHKPSLVISDIIMPEMNGYELCKKIKSDKDTENIPVILLTRLVDPEEIIEGLSCGADSFITKPFNEKYLLSHIEKILSGEDGADLEKVPFGTQIIFKGKKRFIQAEQQNVIKLMLNIYEGAIQQNEKLIQTQEELRLLNDRLESMVEDRTSDLTQEIKLSNLTTNKLKESEEKWRTLVTTIPDYIALLDCEGIFLFLNHYTKEFSENDVIGKSLLNFISDESKEIFRQNFEKCINSGVIQKFEYSAFDGDKIIRTYESYLIPIIQHGKITNIMAIARDITERKLREETIKILARFPSENPDPVLRVDLHGFLLYANEASHKFLTWKLQVGEKVPSFLQKIIGQVLKEGLEKVIETEHNQLVISLKIIPVAEEGYANLYGLDITERKRAEEALLESQHLFQTLAQVSPVGIFRTDSLGNTTYVNPKWSELSGLTLEEASGFKWLIAVHPDDREKLKENWLSDFKSREISKAEYRFIRPDGSIVWVLGNAAPEWIDNKIVGYIGTTTDISQRKQSEITLSESEEKFRSIMEDSADAIFLTDQQGMFVYANKEVTKMFGYSREEIISKRFSYLSPADKVDEHIKLFSKFIGEGKLHIELDLLKKDGGIISTDLTSALLPGGLAYGSFRDITKRKQEEEALKHAKENAEESDQLKTTFLNNISHEVRTPLNGIMGFAEIISNTDLSEADKKDSLNMLRESSDRLLNTITNYMDISLITSGNMTVHKKDFIPGQVLRRIFDNYNVKCLNNNLELFINLPVQSDNLLINSDPEILKKIISQLLDNSIKFTDNGRIEFGFLIDEGKLEFFVKDTGIGIAKKSISSIFEHFIKEARDPSRLSEGSGLGLSVAKGMIGILGGDIRVESEINVGSGFFFTIPFIMKNTITLPGTSVNEHKKTLTGASILVAEDDEINFFYLNSLLIRETGATVLHASDGREAIEIFKANPGIILILMDIKMPELDGIEATRQIKLIRHDIPVIALTAYAMSGDEERVMAAGCDGYLSKPISRKSLIEKMAEFILI